MQQQINKALQLLNQNTQHVRNALINGEQIDKSQVHFPVNKESDEKQINTQINTNNNG